MLLILGTSLNVQPTSKFAIEMADKVPSILVNLESTQYDKDMTLVLNSDLDTFATEVQASLSFGR